MRFHPLVKFGLCSAAFFGLGYAVSKPVLDSARDYAQRSSCRSNVKQLALAYAQYVRDSNGVSPPVSSGNLGWADLLPTSEGLQCPAGINATQPRRNDYFYNARLAGVRQVPFPEQTILFGDGYDNSGTNANLSELPFDWGQR